MKSFLKFSLFFMALMMGLSFVACGSDDDVSESGISSSAIKGSWVYYLNEDGEEYTTTFTFNGKDAGTVNQKINGYSGKYEENFNFFYQLTSEHEGTITIPEGVDFEGYSEYYNILYFLVDGKILYLYESQDYSKRSLVVTMNKK